MNAIITQRYRAGINLGGWLSQCGYEPEHIAGFITEADIARIASWGMDHVRLPVDYPVIEDVNHPFEYLESGFAAIDRALGWCEKYGLNVVLDLHKTPGYAHSMPAESVTFFTDTEMQGRFISIWQAFAKRYAAKRDSLIFELLNEVRDPDGRSWNPIVRRAVEAIRAIDGERTILIGGTFYNSPEGLHALEVWDDEHILYNFHFYEPFSFTHQRAHWTPLKNTDIQQTYPGKIEGMEELVRIVSPMIPGYTSSPAFSSGVYDKAYVKEKLAPALAFAEHVGGRLYCGEYGAIDLANMESRVNWLRDVISLFNEHHIGRAYWTYKGMNFSTIDGAGHPVSDDLVRVIASK